MRSPTTSGRRNDSSTPAPTSPPSSCDAGPRDLRLDHRHAPPPGLQRRLVSLVLPRAAVADRRGGGRATLADLRAAIAANGAVWGAAPGRRPDPEADLVEHGDGWEFHQPAGLRLAQAIHHGTDHRSQVCTALTSLGIEPPEIDLWAYGEATGRTRSDSL